MPYVVDSVHLRADDFEAFFHARAEAFLTRIEQAMGKKVARDVPASIDAEDDSGEEDENGEMLA